MVYSDPPACPHCGQILQTPASIEAEACWACGVPFALELADELEPEDDFEGEPERPVVDDLPI